MECPNCKIPLVKDPSNKVVENQLAYFTNWICEKCGHRKFSLFDVKFKFQQSKDEKNN